MALDGAELGMTFLPGGFGGATGRSAREAAGADDALPALDAADVRALHDYTGPGYGEMNTSLRGWGPLPDTELAERVEAVSAALAKLPKHEGIVYRGAFLDDAKIAVYRPGEIVTERAFTSTSVERAKRFPGNVEFVIRSRTGRDITAYSRAAHETEVLFDRTRRSKCDTSSSMRGRARH
jgi:hypothetical protein